VLDYLHTASQVAPSVLPDVVVLDGVDLASAARAGVLVPLDGRVSPELVNDLLPAARAAGIVDGQLMGIPFQMDAQHLIYNTTQLPLAPLGWADVLSHTVSYLFATQGRNGLVNDAFLIQYLAVGGRFQDDQGGPMLDEAALRAVLDYYSQAAQAGILAPAGLEAGDPEDVGPLVATAKLGMAQVTAHRFLAGPPGRAGQAGGPLRNTQYADIPTRDGKPLTIGRGWALAVVTRDPAQQAMALRLVEWLLNPANNAIWNQTTRYIPTRYAAFRLLEAGDPYFGFLQHLMEVAVPPPAFMEYDQLSRILQQSVVAVLRGEATPEQAAADAVDAVVR
jgi:multiple sugar transport system substrate-binding protein